MAPRSESIFIGLLKYRGAGNKGLSTRVGWGVGVCICQLLPACGSQLFGLSFLIYLIFTVFVISHLTCSRACMLDSQVLIQQLLYQKSAPVLFHLSLLTPPFLCISFLCFSTFLSEGCSLFKDKHVCSAESQMDS